MVRHGYVNTLYTFQAFLSIPSVKSWMASKPLLTSFLMNIQLYSYSFFNLVHVFLRNDTSAAKEPFLANSRQLVSHSLTFLTFKNHFCLAGIKWLRLTGERDNLNSIQEPIRGIVADYHSGSFLLDFPTDRGVKLTHHTSRRFMGDVPECNLSPLDSLLLPPPVSRHFRIG